MDKKGNVKLCDFGWSAESYYKRTTFCGTIDYMAPEMIKNQVHDKSLDIWCLGILLYELLHGYVPFRGKSNQEKCSSILKGVNIIFGDVSKESVDLIQKILKPKPNDRIKMEQIFEHNWMRKFENDYDICIKNYIWRENINFANCDNNEKKKDNKAENISPPSQKNPYYS